jgi:ABC-type transport system involved in cytochrome c biogenesis permease subunit
MVQLMQNPALPVAAAAIILYLAGFYKTGFVYAGLLIQAGYMFYRGMELGRLPILGPHDTLFFMSASTMLFAVPITHSLQNRKKLLRPVAGLTVFFILLSLLYEPHNAPLPPVLKTIWFETHVALSFFSYALFGVAAVLGMLFIINR